MKKKIKSDTKGKKVIIDKFQKIKTFDYLKSINGFDKTGKKVGEFLKQKFKKRKIFLVIMQTINGKYDMFTVATSSEHFTYSGGSYYIDSAMVRENVHAKMNTLFYHQGCSAPFKIDIKLQELKDKLKNDPSKVEKAINPGSLKGFIVSQVIEKVLKGAEMIKDLQMIKMLVIINTLAIVAFALIGAKALGWF